MKLRTKMIIGFGVLVAVFVIAIGVSILGLNTAAGGFQEYRALARDTNLAGRLQANMLMVRMAVKDYVINHSQEDQDAYRESFSTMEGFLEEAQESIENPARKKMIDQTSKIVESYDSFFLQLVEHAEEGDRQFEEVLDIVGPKMEQQLTKIISSAEKDGDMTASYNASQAMRSLLLARLYVLKYQNENLAQYADRVTSEFDDLDNYLNVLDRNLENPERRALLQSLLGENKKYLQAFTTVVEETNTVNEILEKNLNKLGPEVADLTEQVKLSVMDDQNLLGPKLEANNQNSILLISIISVVAVILAVIITFITTASVLKQLGADPGIIETIMQRVALGDLAINAADYKIKRNVGVFESVMDMVNSLQNKADMVETVASGDLSVHIAISSEEDVLGKSLEKMKNSLNELLHQVNVAVDQVNSGADQVSQASQSLSQGATEQASSLEEITSSTTEINSQSKQNAENASEAHGLAKQATKDAETGNQQMRELEEVMQRINASSDEINKVVKVIDDIAFQINLLALNANVEAARAGKYGKGFAVVAEEVRNLAVKSATSVQETTRMVEETVSNISQGSKAADATAKQLQSIVEGSGKVANFLEEISTASREQAQAIDQITEGLDQIDQVTQSNTASAEQSASASEELAGQAQQLHGLIGQFRLDPRFSSSGPGPQIQGGGNYGEAPQRREQRAPSTPSHQHETGIVPVRPEDQISLDDDDFDRF